MSEPQIHDEAGDSEDRIPISVESHGVKVSITPDSTGKPPESWGDVAARLNRLLMRITLSVPAFVADTFEGAAALVRGLTGTPDAFNERLRNARSVSDRREAEKQANVVSNLPAPQDVKQRLEDRLRELQEQGHHVELRDLGEGRVAIVIVQEVHADLVEEVLQRALPAPESRDA